MEQPRYRNMVREQLQGRGFAAVVEFTTPEAAEEFEGAVAPIVELGERIKGDPRVHGVALTDRVKSDDDHDPVRVGLRVAEASHKTTTVHLSGKDRGPAYVADALARMAAAGLENVLAVTGDKVKGEPGDRRVRYYDSVNIVAQAREAGDFFVAAAVSPFKYREEESMNQYLKMAKKENAGADYLITQVGWDMLKLKELAAYRRRRGLRAPVTMGMMLLTVARARYIRAHRLAGITITDALQACLEADAARPDKGVATAYRRLALQIVGLKRLGFHGFQLTGMHAYDKLDRLLRQVEALEAELPTEADWWDAWWEALRGPDGRPVETAPAPYYLFEELGEPGGWRVPLDRLTERRLEPPPAPSTAELQKYRALDGLDRLVFRDGSPGAAVLRPLARLVPPRSMVDRGLHWVERCVKAPVVGCQTCGFCRLPYTAYVCPETCPKGLANGPCGGTSENQCEFGDRECIHNRKYRIAREAGRLAELEELLIPAVEPARRGTCSWTTHFRGEDPAVVRLPDVRAKGSCA